MGWSAPSRNKAWRPRLPYIRGILGRTLTLRRVPELRFVRDDTLGQAQRIEALLREVRPTEGEELDSDDAGDQEE